MTTEIVLTPKWAGVFMVYVAVLQNPDASAEAQNTAMSELRRMAQAADKWNEYVKSLDDPPVGVDL